MKLRHFTFILSTLLIAAIFADCNKKKDPVKEEETQEAAFDKPAMLANYADNLILPNLQAFKASVDQLVSDYTAFNLNKTVANLATLRQAYMNASVQFQHISTFEFGPSESEIIRSNFNTYPTDTTQVTNNIASGNYNLGILSNLDAKGFPAIDFLLFGKNETDVSIITRFNTVANRHAYVLACLTEIQTKTNTVINSWNTGYRNTFVASTGMQIGSSLGMMINQVNFEIDVLKNSKLGIPLGKKSLGVKLPEKCEGYYANTFSIKLAKECLLNIEDVYLGRSAAGVNGKGIDDYLDALGTQHGSVSLNAAIQAQFAIAKTKLALVAEPLSASVISDAAAVDAAYVEIVKLLVLLKTDVPSTLGIVITYQDGDGD